MRKPSWWKWSCFGSIEIFIKTVFKTWLSGIIKVRDVFFHANAHSEDYVHATTRFVLHNLPVAGRRSRAMAENTFTMAGYDGENSTHD